MSDPISQIKPVYLMILQTAIWLLSIITPFIMNPPALFPDQENIWTYLTQFFVAAFIGLMLYPMIRFTSRSYTSTWWKIGIALFISSIILSASYLMFYRKNTIAIEDESNSSVRVVIGSKLTSNAAREKEHILKTERRIVSNSELIELFPPNNLEELSNIWQKESIETNTGILASVHLFTVLVLSLLVLTVVQVLKCLNMKPNEN